MCKTRFLHKMSSDHLNYSTAYFINTVICSSTLANLTCEFINSILFMNTVLDDL